LQDFKDSAGINPMGCLTINNGIAYGIASMGGQGGGGTIYSYSLQAPGPNNL